MKIAVDTNVLIYVLQAHKEFGMDARLVISSFSKDSIFASEAVFGEILANTIFKNNETAYSRVRRFLENLDITYVPTSREIYVEAAKVRRQRPTIKLPDAIHLVSAWHNDASAFITNDERLIKASTDARKIVSLKRFAGKL